MKKILISVLFLLSFYSYAQNEPCAADSVMDLIYNQHPEQKEHADYIDAQIANFIAEQRTTNLPPAGSIIIPTVIYIIYDGTTSTDLSNDQALQQLDALNQKFYDTGIKFCLGGSTSNINVPMKNTSDIQTVRGIIHVNNSNLMHHNKDNDQQNLLNTAHSSVGADKYLRIWVVNSITSGNNSTIKGYAYDPSIANSDGVVIIKSVFGNIYSNNLLENFNEGETLVHEVGHYFGLKHPFLGGCSSPNNNPLFDNDKVEDTPKVATANYYCIYGTNSCIENPEYNDLIHNYMDYGNNTCTDSFTNGQKQRMINIINIYYLNLTSVENQILTGVCGSDNLFSAKINADKFYMCANSPEGISFNASDADSYLWNFGDGSTSNIQNPQHVYTSSVNSPYTVTLTVSGTGPNGIFQQLTSSEQIFVSDCSIFLPNSKSKWYFSRYSKLDFNTGIPIFDPTFNESTSDFSTNFRAAYGSSSIQNTTSGNVLFYTNKFHVFDAQNQPLDNNPQYVYSSSYRQNNSLIIPKPGDNTKYYLFNSGNYGGNTQFENYDKFTYRLINTSNATNIVAGAFNPISYPSTFNFLKYGNGNLQNRSGMTAIKKCDGYWLLTILEDVDFNKYIVVYSVTNTIVNNGINYVSRLKLPSTLNNQNSFSIIVSPNGNKIFAFSIPFIPIEGVTYPNYMLDFNKYNGIASKPFIVNASITGASFSPDSNLLYLKANHFDIYQLNLNSLNINQDKKLVYTESFSGINTNHFGDMQIGPDNKIYLANNNHHKLGVINNPNNIVNNGSPNACNFSVNGPKKNSTGISLSSTMMYGSLPNVIVAETETAYPTQIENKISKYLIGCNKYKFFPNVCGYSSFRWEFKNLTTGTAAVISTLTTPEYEFVAGNNYSITLKNSSNTQQLASMNITTSTNSAVNILGSSSACIDENPNTNNSVNLSNDQTILWSAIGGTIDGQNNFPEVDVNWTTLPGQLTATVTNSSGCVSSATKTITSVCCQECLDSLYWVSINTPNPLGQYKQCVLPNNPNPSCEGLAMQYTWKVKTSNVTTISNCSNYYAQSQLPIGVKVDILDSGNNVLCSTNFGQGFARNSNSSNTNLLDKNISVSPNPSNGLYSIKINDFEGNINISVFDINGRLIYNEKNINFNQEKTIDLSIINSGVYFLKIENESINHSQKLIKN